MKHKNKLYKLIKPFIFTDLNGKNPRDEWWGKYLKYGYEMGGDTLFNPIFVSLWPGVWISNKELKTRIKELYWYEWIEYFIRLRIARIKTFIHYLKIAIKCL